MIVVAAETGLRPQELANLEWRDIQGGVVVVERTFSADSGLRSYGKTERSVRRVPLTERGRVALRETPRRIDMPAVFASPRSPRVDRHNFRSREWLSALVGAKIEKEDHRGRHRRIYDLRHTYASNVLAAGVSLLELSRFMGTSVELLDKTYGHLVLGAEDQACRMLDAYAARQ